MISAIVTLSLIGAGLGIILSAVNHFLPYLEDPQAERIENMMPGTQCGQCGYAGCRPAATALVAGEAPLTLCPPGGAALVRQLAAALDRDLDESASELAGPSIAVINHDQCIGCTKCLKDCPTDALVGSAKQMHVVLEDACTGCNACVDVCPTECISMQEIPLTLGSWRWHKPSPEILARA